MKLFLNKTITIETIEGVQLSNQPRLFLDTRRLGISNGDRFGFSEEKSRSIGSMESWLEFDDCDEIGFDKDTKMLRFVFFRYSEKDMSLDFEALSKITSIKASIKILPYKDEFVLIPFTNRNYNSELGKLFSFPDDFSISDDLLEIEISPDFSLYFQDKMYCAWSIKNPEKYLSDINWEFINEPINPTLKENFQEIMDLTSENNIELMEEQDNRLLLRLIALYESSILDYSQNSSKGSKILSQRVLDLAAIFYDNENKIHFGNQ
ncbi:MAG: hypothetical protein ACO1N0_19435 [Fluviicola sp.]